jgi:hypothetical protein
VTISNATVEQLRDLAAAGKPLLQEERRILIRELAKHHKRVRVRGRAATPQEAEEVGKWFRAQRGLEEARKERWLEFALRKAKPWAGLTDDDWRFRQWATQKPKEDREKYAERLAAACIYEYARHDRRLKCLLLLTRSDDAPQSFEGLKVQDAEEGLGPWFAVLGCLAKELAKNLPWAKVRAERQRRAIWIEYGGNSVPRSASGIGEFFLGIPPVAAKVTTAEAMPVLASVREPGEEIPARVGLRDGVEVVAMRVNWADSTNKELGDEFAAWARRNRPADVPEPNRKKTAWRADVSRRRLDSLTVWRLIRLGGKTTSEAAQMLAEHGCNTEANGGGDSANVGKLLKEAGEFFNQWFGSEPQAVKVSKPN